MLLSVTRLGNRFVLEACHADDDLVRRFVSQPGMLICLAPAIRSRKSGEITRCRALSIASFDPLEDAQKHVAFVEAAEPIH